MCLRSHLSCSALVSLHPSGCPPCLKRRHGEFIFPVVTKWPQSHTPPHAIALSSSAHRVEERWGRRAQYLRMSLLNWTLPEAASCEIHFFCVLLLCLRSLAFSGPSSLQQGFLEVLQFLFCSTALSCWWQCPGLKAILVSLLDLILHHLHKLLKLHLINVTFFFLWFNQHFALWSYLLFTQYC